MQDTLAVFGSEGWWERTGMILGPVGEQEFDFSSSECERLVQYPVEISAPVPPSQKGSRNLTSPW